MAVTVCFVTRNHAPSLGRAIRSIRGLASEVLVGDTGSTDHTLAVAEESGARVITIAWTDDFAAACNDTLAAATGGWILWLNPDEEVEPEGLPLLTAAMADPGLFAWRLLVRQETRADRPKQGVLGWEYRLYRRDPSIRYRGRLHPEFETPLEQLAAARGQAVSAIGAIIRRHAYLSIPTPDRIPWVVRLLEAELRDRPGQVGYLIELGRNLLWLNDPRGHEVLGEAAEIVRRVASDPVPPSPWVGSLIEYLLSVDPKQTGTTASRTVAREWAARWFPFTPPVLWAVAGERFASNDYPAAAGLLENLIRIGQTAEYVADTGFSKDIIGTSAVMNLGVCYLHLDRWDDARACFVKLFHDPERETAARQGYRLAELRQRPDR